MTEEEKKQPIKKKFDLNIFLRYFLRTRRYLAIATGTVLLAVLAIIWIIIPRIGKVQAAWDDMNEASEKLEELQDKLNKLETVEQQDLYLQRERLHSILPSYKPVLLILSEIQRVSGETGTVIVDFGVNPGQISTQSAQPARSAREDDEFVDTEVTIVGRVEQINDFLKSIGTITPLTEITSMTLRSITREGVIAPDEQSNEGIFEAAISLQSHFYLGKPTLRVDQKLIEYQLDQNFSSQLQQFVLPERSEQFLPQGIEGGGKEDLFSPPGNIQLLQQGATITPIPELEEETTPAPAPEESAPTEVQATPTPTPANENVGEVLPTES